MQQSEGRRRVAKCSAKKNEPTEANQQLCQYCDRKGPDLIEDSSDEGAVAEERNSTPSIWLRGKNGSVAALSECSRNIIDKGKIILLLNNFVPLETKNV